MKILIVDDSASFRKVVVRALASYDCTICEAGNGEQAIAAAQNEFPRVDLILLDISMPNVNGMETLAMLKDDPDLKSIPVIMVTADDSENNVNAAFDMGAVNYLVKPLQADDLAAGIRGHVSLIERKAA